MDYLTNYYKNLSEQLQERVNHLQKLVEAPQTVHSGISFLSPKETGHIMAIAGDDSNIAMKLADMADYHKQMNKDNKNYNLVYDKDFNDIANKYSNAVKQGKRAEDEVGYDTGDDRGIVEPSKGFDQKSRDVIEKQKEKYNLPWIPNPFNYFTK